MGRRHETGITSHLFAEAQGLHSYKQKYSLESANTLTMCPKGNQSDADKRLCHIRHIFLTPISHTLSPVQHPLRSSSASRSALPSESGPCLHLAPSHSSLLPTSLAPDTPKAASQPSSLPRPEPAVF